MLAIIFIESHGCKHCVETLLALRNGTQSYAKGGAFVSSERGSLGFERGTFAQFAKSGGGAMSPRLLRP